MLTPTHVQVAVVRTRDLIVKGKHGSNDVFIIYSLGKQKFQSSVKEKASDSLLEWNEGCDIAIPSAQGNKAELVLKVLHKASMGDKFLGRVALPLSDFDVTAKAKPKWYPLKPKPGSEKDTKFRGEIEVKVSFLIKSNPSGESTSDLSSKTKRKDSLRSSLGSILSLGKKKKKDKNGLGSSKESISSSDSLRNVNGSRLNLNNNLPIINDDPGVISEEEDDRDKFSSSKFDKAGSRNSMSGSFSEKLSSYSAPTTPQTKKGFKGIFTVGTPNASVEELNETPVSPKSRTVRLPSIIMEEPPSISVTRAPSTSPPPPKPPAKKLPTSASMSNLMDTGGKGTMKKPFKSLFSSAKHLDVEGTNDSSATSQSQPQIMKKSPSLRELKIPKETFKQYERKSKEELIAMILNLQGTVDTQKQKIGDLEDYIDKLLLRVLDNMPGLLKKGNSFRVD